MPVEDPDMKLVVNELGNALRDTMPGATAAEIGRIIGAVDALIEVKIAQFVEMAADRVDALRDTAA